MSPSDAISRARAWFAQRYAKRCKCEGLDVRVDGKRLECGKCGARIDARVLDERAVSRER
jgi:hypothetical protein